MPRPRDIVMGNTTAEQRREAVISRAIEVHQPYKVFKQYKYLGFDNPGWCVVYTSPRDQTRHVVLQDLPTSKRARARVRLLEQAWAEGYYASQQNTID